MVDLSKSGDGLTIHFDTLQPYIGWVCFSRYLSYLKLTKEGSWKLHPELSEVGIEQWGVWRDVRECEEMSVWAELGWVPEEFLQRTGVLLAVFNNWALEQRVCSRIWSDTLNEQGARNWQPPQKNSIHQSSFFMKFSNWKCILLSVLSFLFQHWKREESVWKSALYILMLIFNRQAWSVAATLQVYNWSNLKTFLSATLKASPVTGLVCF